MDNRALDGIGQIMRFSKTRTSFAVGAGLGLFVAGLAGCGGTAPNGGSGRLHDEPPPPPPPNATATAAASAAPGGAPEVFRVGSITMGEAAPDVPDDEAGMSLAGDEAEGAPDPEVKKDKPIRTTGAPKPLNEKKPTERSESVMSAVVDATAGLSQEEVRATIGNRQGSFRACYTIGAASGPFQGTVFVRASVGPTGAVASAEVTSSTTKNVRVDSCVLDAVRVLQFPAKGGGAVVSFPIEFGG